MRRLVLVLSMVAAVMTACGGGGQSDDGRLDVVANFYPVAYAAERVAGDIVDVRNLTPAGVEPHDLELTSDDVDRVESADVVFYVGEDFQPALDAVVERRDNSSVDVAEGLLTNDDAHFWLDPTLVTKAVDAIEQGLSKADPENTETYAENAAAYKAELADLDREFRTTLSRCTRKKIVTAHAAFGYLADRYGLTQHAISGVEPESEPDPQHLADLADLIRREAITTVFYEDLVPREFADTLAREAGARTAVLNPLEGLSEDEVEAGDTYLSVMRKNLAALAGALDCGG